MDEQQREQYHQAQEHVKKQEWGRAADILNKLVEKTADPAVVRLLVRVLNEQHQYVQAFDNILETPEAFWENASAAELAVRVMGQCQRFMTARLFIANGPAEWRQHLSAIEGRAEAVAQDKYRQTIQQRLRDFCHLGDGDLVQQKRRLAVADELPLAAFLQGAKFVLRDPFVFPLVRSDIIESLRQIKLDENLTYLWIDNREYQVNPAKISAQDELPAVKEVRAVITHKLADYDAISYRMANQQFDLHMMFLFPRAEFIITDPQAWATGLLQTLNGKKLKGSTPTIRWQKLIMEKIAELSQIKK